MKNYSAFLFLFFTLTFASDSIAAVQCVEHFMAGRGPREKSFYSKTTVVRGRDVKTGKWYQFFRIPFRSGYSDSFALKGMFQSVPPADWQKRLEKNFKSKQIFELETGEFLIIKPTYSGVDSDITTLARIPVTEVLFRYGRDEPLAKSRHELVASYLNDLKFTSVPEVTRFIADHQDQIVEAILNGWIRLEDLTEQQTIRVRDAKTGTYYGMLLSRNSTIYSILFLPSFGGEKAYVLKHYKKPIILIFGNENILQINGTEKFNNIASAMYEFKGANDLKDHPDFRFKEF